MSSDLSFEVLLMLALSSGLGFNFDEVDDTIGRDADNVCNASNGEWTRSSVGFLFFVIYAC